jgi:hypothetical protein
VPQRERETVETPPIRWRGKDGSYEITLSFAWIGGMECVGVLVQAERDAPVTARALHAIPLGKLIEKRRPKPGELTLAIENASHSHTAGNLVLTTSSPRRGGRPPKYPPEHWRAVARVYEEAYHGNRTPTRAVAKHFRVTESAAAKWVAKCRNDLGLLPKTTRGKAKVVHAVARTATVRAVASVPTPTVRATGGGATKPKPRKTKRARRGGSR